MDVNNTAKPPSEARLVLLSDTELRNIFARELLNRLRREHQWEERFPLFGVEYDNPVAAVTTPRRWSVVTNLEILKDSVVRVIFGPPKLLDHANASLQGKPNYKEMNRFMRERLEVGKLFPKEFHDGQHRMLREGITDECFPINDNELHGKLLDAFYDRWGRGILHLLSEVKPYRTHLDVLRARYKDWNVADNVQTLAKDALFEGVGMFWTIEDGHKLWIDDKREAQENSLPSPSQPDISRAWQILEEQEKPLFAKLRAKAYFGSDEADEIKDADRLFQGLITYAAQLGLVLAWASLHRLAGPKLEPFAVAEVLANAINSSLDSGPIKSRDRRKALLKRSEATGFCPLNELPKLEPSLAIYYRYLWLEVALIEKNAALWDEAGIDLEAANVFLQSIRAAYLRYLSEERRKQRLRDAEIRLLPEKEQKKRAQEMANQEIIDSQAKAHKYWFGGEIAEHRNMVAAALGAQEADEDTEGNESDTDTLDDSQNGDDELQI